MIAGCGGSSSGENKDNSANQLTVSQHTLEVPNAVTSLTYQFQPEHDALAGNLKYSADTLPGWATIDPETGLIAGIPGPEDASAESPVSVIVSNDSRRLVLKGTIVVEHAEAFLEQPALDFYSTNFEGEPRALRNDLSGGALAGEVQFVQSHSVAPAGNYERNIGDETQSRYMPKLTALRDALLLFIPSNDTEPTTVHVEVSVNGEPLMTLPMAHPNALPESDVTGTNGIQYSKQAWSVRLPWDAVRNGLSLRFVANKDAGSRTFGNLPSSEIEIGEASQLVLQSIRLGMLTAPSQVNGHYTLRDPVMAATDYFQTLPVSRLVMGSYADAILDRVIIRSGVIYDKDIDGASAVEGSVYSGDMRENVAKSQVSVGINMANFGYTSHHMNQGHPHVFKQITNHHAWGMYANGRVDHGLSGGNGIGTLYHSWGNEASHEWGHAYGLGHYPGKGLTDDGRWAVHHADSGWGYIAHRNRMRANLFGLNEDGSYNFKRDAMSGGSDGGPFSVYTHYTGYSARFIQNDIAKFPVPDENYPSGYKKWDTTTGQYQDYRSEHPVPVRTGVPVATLLGGYDPDGTAAVIYPVFHGNYGNVFDLPEPDLNATNNQCWVTVKNQSDEQKRIQIAASRHNANSINQFHFNLAADFRPTNASLHCRRDGIDQMLTQTAFDGEIPDLPPVAVVGQGAAYQQLREQDMVHIAQALKAMDSNRLNILDDALAIKVASYSAAELKNHLPEAAWGLLQRLEKQQAAVRQIAILLGKAERDQWSSQKTREHLLQALTDNGLAQSPDELVPIGDVIRGNGRYFDSNLEDATHIALTELPDDISNASHWIRDLRGRIHPADAPWQCLTPVASRIGLAPCLDERADQRWAYNAELLQLRNEASGKCLDYDRSNDRLITYGCSGNWNQQWAGVATLDSPLFALFDGPLLRKLYGALLPD
ncbi:M66 family metalloprotease [Marinobacter litoralis]|uniref:M66 family metalloprotease n=1 Tax=Marinobacter litoralis TaxID=187981 RepID=UPI0014024653|nr:M66 family metalloprotease [Marinobacter litoralis]